MKTSQITSLPSPYEELLFRYARIIVKNKLVAVLIVEDVEKYYRQRINAVSQGHLRDFLKTYTLQNCRGWLNAKDNALNAREPKDPT